MMHRFMIVVVVVPLAIILTVLAVANRAVVPFTIDPFNPGNPGLTVELPLFVHLIIAIILGVIIGGAVTWFRQGRYRRMARERSQEVERLRHPEPGRTTALNPRADT